MIFNTLNLRCFSFTQIDERLRQQLSKSFTLIIWNHHKCGRLEPMMIGCS
ncbi:Uncharacterised protein [Mycobacteroides abscessus]|nr:Uncharacterised protein [Mycobacteroides abscessus]